MRLLRSTPTVLFVVFLLLTCGTAARGECQFQGSAWLDFGDITWPGNGGTDNCSFIVGFADNGGIETWPQADASRIEVELDADFGAGELPGKTVLSIFDIRDYSDQQLVVLEILNGPATVEGDLVARLLYRDGQGQIHVLSDPQTTLPRSNVKLKVVWQRTTSDTPGADILGSGSVQLWADRGGTFELLAADDSLFNPDHAVMQTRFGNLGHSGPQPTGEGRFELKDPRIE